MSDTGLGLRQGTLGFVAHRPAWALAYRDEVARITARLPETPFRIDHIGSTAVPGLLAKPILDIGMQARDHARVARALGALGYIDRGERSGRLFVRLHDSDIRTHNLHLYAPNAPELVAQIAFRDRLRADPDLCAAYAAEKRRIFAETNGQRRGYAEAKTDFILAACPGARPAPSKG